LSALQQTTGLDGWSKTHAVSLAAGEIAVPETDQKQQIASQMCRGRFITGTRKYGLATAGKTSDESDMGTLVMRQNKCKSGFQWICGVRLPQTRP
jgi:hypothetical protein